MLDRRMLSFLTSDDPDAALISHLAEAVAETPGESVARWRPGEPLRLLLMGSLGAGDTSAEMRIAATVRQLRDVLGTDVVFDAVTQTAEIRAGVLPGVRPLVLEGYPPDAIRAAVDAAHGVIACDAVLFRSSCSNVLSAMNAAALGIAARQGKIAVGWGGEIGGLEPMVADMVRDVAAGALMLPLDPPSLAAAESLGLRAAQGADPAWSLAAAEPAAARARLEGLGWNGRLPVLAVCPANPFWWPVTADPEKAAEMRTSGTHSDVHHSQLLFHADSVARRAAYRGYIENLSQAVAAIGMFSVYVAIDRADAAACRDLAKLVPAPVVNAADLPLGETLALLRAADLLVSSRFHALVGAMPAGRPSIGLTRDERAAQLIDPSRIVAPDSKRMVEELILLSARLDADAIAASSKATLDEGFAGIARMGEALVAEVRRLLPDYPVHA